MAPHCDDAMYDGVLPSLTTGKRVITVWSDHDGSDGLVKTPHLRIPPFRCQSKPNRKPKRSNHGGPRRQRRHQWKTGPTMSRSDRIAMDFGRWLKKQVPEMALMARGQDQVFDQCTFLADTGASTHMIGDDEGLIDVTEIHKPIVIGDGKVLYATKIG